MTAAQKGELKNKMNKNQLINHFRQQKDVLAYLLVLTGFFILLEISFFIQCHQMHFKSFAIVSKSLHFPLIIMPDILFFIVAQLAVHFIYAVGIWCVTVALSLLLRLSSPTAFKLSCFCWLSGLLFALCANQYYFPHSLFAELTATILINSFILKISLFACAIVWSVMLLLVFVSLLRCMPWLILGVSISILLLQIMLSTSPQIVADAATPSRPNIILIGADSLRPDFLSFFGGEQHTPFFDAFLNQATVFNEAVTPIARTFPSWVAILTGQYPHESGVRTNLFNQMGMNYSQSLPALLRQAGYETIFATDETRFSNIDARMGFDRMIVPPMGFNDFLLGTLNDFPLSNLLINTPVGAWIFPYSYANRPVYYTYEPDTFLKRIRPMLATPRNKPVFLTIHFCLTHAPYHWADSPAQGLSIQQRYSLGVNRIDQQIGDFFTMLKQYHLLDHAIVVLLSDHGEALELPGDRITEASLFVGSQTHVPVPLFYPPGLDDEKVDQSVGHGTDVLGLAQYHTVLAWQLFGVGKQYHGTVPGVVTLLSIKPTILSLIGESDKSAAMTKSMSLAAYIRGEAGKLPVKSSPVFLESDFSPPAIRSVHPEVQDVVMEGIHAFQIDSSTGHLVVRDTMVKVINDSKQYAIINGDWMLALYPQKDHHLEPILVNLTNGRWTNNLQTTFAQQAKANSLLSELKAFYGKDIHSPVN